MVGLVVSWLAFGGGKGGEGDVVGREREVQEIDFHWHELKEKLFKRHKRLVKVGAVQKHQAKQAKSVQEYAMQMLFEGLLYDTNVG